MDFEGIRCDRNDPPFFQKYKGERVLIMAPAPCIFTDLEVASGYDFDQLIAVNDAIYLEHNFDHFVSLHDDTFYRDCDVGDAVRHGKSTWMMQDINGTSGLFSVMVAVLMGFSKIVLAGMPLDSEGHFNNDVPSEFDVKGNQMRSAWCSEIQNGSWSHKVRSLSGRTKFWLGAPTKEWFNGK